MMLIVNINIISIKLGWAKLEIKSIAEYKLLYNLLLKSS